jgi:hypothetical protein
MKKSATHPRLTRFGRFLAANDLKPSLVADLSGVSRQHLYRIRYRRCEPTRKVMVALWSTCRKILRRTIQMSELFNLGEGEP